jgi:transcriptional regulator with XRE-family HTH domain
MARKKVDFTVEEVFEEVVETANELHYLIGETLDDHYYNAVLENSHCYEWKKKEFDMRELDGSYIVEAVRDIYIYAADGIITGENDISSSLFCMNNFSKLVSGYNKNFDSKYDFLYNTAFARDRLDCGVDLSLKELALLAGVDERTIRNSASSKDEGSLEIKKSGSSTMFGNAEAKKWLNNRPDFKPTRDYDDAVVQNEKEFGEFISQKRNELELTLDDVANAIEVDLETLIDLEKGIDRLYLSQVSKLQNTLKIEENKLLGDYMKIFHYHEFLNLSSYFNQAHIYRKSLQKLVVKSLDLKN